MVNNSAIRLNNVSKVYRLYNRPTDRLKESLHPLRRQYHHVFYALNNISLEISKGDSVGIIGKNGSGKSTLLKVITGVLAASTGTVDVIGKVSALLELGSGFNPELTGLENVYFSGMLMGYSREETHQRIDSILSFADIGEFIYQPVKTYSSGMFVRLAFAVAVNVDPDILIVDEALAVGDLRFQKKCKTRMAEFRELGRTILLVSHTMADIRAMCGSCLYLKDGAVEFFGNTFNAINRYTEQESRFEADDLKMGAAVADSIPNNSTLADIAGTGDMIITDVRCYQEGNNPSNSEIGFGKVIVIEFNYEAYAPINDPVITVNIGCATYRIIANMRSTNHYLKLKILQGKGKVIVKIPNQQFYPGAYVVHVAATSENVNVHLFMHNYAAGFIITPPKDRLLCYPAALVQPEAEFIIEPLP